MRYAELQNPKIYIHQSTTLKSKEHSLSSERESVQSFKWDIVFNP